MMGMGSGAARWEVICGEVQAKVRTVTKNEAILHQTVKGK